MPENVTDVRKLSDEDMVAEVDRKVVVYLMQEHFNLLTLLEDAMI